MREPWLLLLLIAACFASFGSAVVGPNDLAGEQQQQQQQQQQGSLGEDPFLGSGQAPPAGLLSGAINPACPSYIVQLKDPSAVQWAARTEASAAGAAVAGGGSVSSATLTSGSVRQYAAFLKTQADAVAARALGSSDRVKAHYQYSFAGMYVQCVSPTELEALQSDPGVASVTLNTAAKLATVTTPNFLGLDAPGGAWAQLGGLANAGEDVVIGMLDSGYWPESGSFSDQADPNSNSGGAVYGPPPAGFTGTCDAGSEPTAVMCNAKVIACRAFTQGTESIFALNDTFGLFDLFPNEYANCRDAGGHGTHTGSTAGGNAGVATGMAQPPLTSITGMAPRTRLAIYKVCWGAGVACPNAAIVAAIEQALKDGVNIISYSISGFTTLNSPIEVAFKNAAATGIFISAAAGNRDPEGPGVLVSSPGPWSTTVAASTHHRALHTTITLGDLQQFLGQPLGSAPAGFAPPNSLGPHALILSDDAGLPGAKPQEVQLCYNGTLDPDKVRGKIVVCDRGIRSLRSKSDAVKLAGGVGLILLNTPSTPDDNAATVHALPTAHLRQSAREAVRAHAATPGAVAIIGLYAFLVEAPTMGRFSVRGPTRVGFGELLKPDITGPGVDVLAATSPKGNGGKTVQFYSGTSMATPHISGIAALIKQRHPGWSPMMIKSAIMTTAYQTTKTGPSPGQVFGGPFDFGAGHVDPTAALNPGLVFDSTPRDWERFVCGAELLRSDWEQRCPECLTDASLCDPLQLNTPSITAQYVLKSQTAVRTVTSVLSEAAEFTVSVANPPGFDVVVTPASFSLQPGESAALSITITWQGAPQDTYASGAISWSSNKGTVTRIPVVAQASYLQHPGEVWFAGGGNPEMNNLTFNVKAGFTGTLSTLAVGMEPARVYEGSVSQDPDGVFDPVRPVGTAVSVSVTVSKWTYVRFALFDGDVPAGTNLDMHLYSSSGSYLAGSRGPTTNEQLGGMVPQSTSFTVYVHGRVVPGGSAGFKLHVFVLRLPSPGSSNTRSLPHAGRPAQVTAGSIVPVTLTFNQRLLAPGRRHLGMVQYGIKPSDGNAVPVSMQYATAIYIV